MTYDWNFTILRPYARDFERGILITIFLGLGSSIAGTILGLPLGWALRRSRGLRIGLLANDALRSLPTLFLILVFNYFPWREVFGIQPLSPFLCALCALTLGQATFTADLVRGAIANVQPGPLMAARALGIGEKDIALHVAMPDVIRQILPAISAFWVGNLKLASLSSAIGVQDVVFVARVAAGQQFRSLEAWVVVAVIYLILLTPLTTAVRLLESHKWLKRR